VSPLRDDLAAVTAGLAEAAGAINGLTDEITVLRDLLSGTAVPRQEAGDALKRLGESVLTGTASGLILHVLLRLVGA
jgi:hypothetical protein